MNILIWHVHGSWTTAFVQGRHTYLLPVTPGRGPEGRGRADTWCWPASAREVTPAELAEAEIDVVVLQRPLDEALAAVWLGGRRPGRDLPAVWLEHNAPQGRIGELRHPAADRRDVVIVHVTHTNALFWDTGAARTTVIEHGVIDPGLRYRGDEPRAAVVVNEPRRRGRVAGTDLLVRLSEAAPLDVFGMQTDGLAGWLGAPDGRVRSFENLTQGRLHDELARRRVYLHPYRWTSLGLALIEAMMLGLPVAALAVTEAPIVVPDAAGVLTNRIDELADGLRRLNADPDLARACGLAARTAATERFGLDRFLADWDNLLEGIA